MNQEPDNLISSYLVNSYNDYRDFIKFALEKLSPHNTKRFCVWCLIRYERDFGADIFDGLITPEIEDAKNIVMLLKSSVEENKPLNTDILEDLQNKIMNFGPKDEVEAIEVGIENVEFLSALWTTLEYFKTSDIHQVCQVSETIINCVDHYVDESNYTLQNMFTFHSMKDEINLQRKYIAGLVNMQSGQP